MNITDIYNKYIHLSFNIADDNFELETINYPLRIKLLNRNRYLVNNEAQYIKHSINAICKKYSDSRIIILCNKNKETNIIFTVKDLKDSEIYAYPSTLEILIPSYMKTMEDL